LVVLIAAFFILSGLGEITKSPATYPKTIKMGYPPFFILALGIAKLLGAAALLLPIHRRFKEWAFAGFTFDVIFAFISGWSVESPADYIKAVFVFCVLMTAYVLFVKKSAQSELSTDEAWSV
jgi:uncharacterized membrane protein YphA (DoxX/SURF4 family)